MAVQQIFSEYEAQETAIKIAGSQVYEDTSCVGSSEENLNAKVITKSCRGIVKKKIVKGDGTGTLKLSLHCPYELYADLHGMNIDSLVDGVKGYGQKSVHKEFSCVQKVVDEDGVVKYKAYPRLVKETGVVRKIENGAEEVAEIEIEASIMPDEYGFGMYEALAEDLSEGTLASTWMTAFTPELVQAETV